ncbi:MAG: LemA family protein [Propionibacteriaceae bacterium]|jgi:LemA protein|nr:LemA family protein [Propionibacteriaceae bacterium]
MSILLWVPVVSAAVALIGLILAWTTHNRLVELGTRADEAWSDVTVQLKRRADLIPNLVESVKGAAAHEQATLTQVVAARSALLQATGQGPRAAAVAEGEFADALRSLLAVAESHPDIKTNHNFLALQHELVNTEDKIQAARRLYNGSARNLNIKLRAFPSNIFAGLFHFHGREFFEVADRAGLEDPAAISF